MKNSHCLIVSVGTSITDKDRMQKVFSYKINYIDYNKIDQEINVSECENLQKYYRIFISQIDSILNDKKDSSKLAKISQISAEIKTIYKFLEKLNLLEKIKQNITIENVKVYLFPTFTYISYISALLIRHILIKYFNFKNENIKFVITKNLKKANDNDFAKLGLPEFISNMTDVIKKNINDSNIYIIPTGGYKALIPYMVVLGLLFNTNENPIKINYIYEDSDSLLELPLLPININFTELKVNYQKIKILLSSDNPKTEDFIKNESIKSLFVEKGGRYELNEFGKVVLDIYTWSEHKTPLDIQTLNMSILDKLKDPSSNNLLFEYFINLSNIGSKFWIGDKLPEMVDHALYHHDNLFVIADIILTYLFNKKNDFLNPKELFILLSAIYFHDWGHVLSYLDVNGEKIPLLPNEIRDFHHILSYQRIRESYKELYNDLKWENNPDGMLNNYLELIGHVCLYHRKKMPLKNDKNNNYYECTLNKQKYLPLENLINNLNFQGETINGKIDILFVTALFRIIDSLDTQYLRIGSSEELKYKILSFISDMEGEKQRLNILTKDIMEMNRKDEYKDKCLINELNEIYENIISKREDYNPRDDLENIKFNNYLSFSYLENKLKIYFKTYQLEHFFRHLYFESPSIYFDDSNGKYFLKIKFKRREDFIENQKLILDLLKEKKEFDLQILVEAYSDPCKIVREIKSDYNEEVKKILESRNLILEYYFVKSNGNEEIIN